MRSSLSEQVTVSDDGGGYLSGIYLAPLMVLIVGCLLAILAFHAPGPVPAEAAAADDRATVIAGAQAETGGIAPFFMPSVQAWASAILRWAAAAGVDPDLAATVMQIESCGDPFATSRSGAMGLFQVMPFHFIEGEYPYDPETNARRGLDYLHRSLDAAAGNAALAFAGYNGGISVIARDQLGWASETVRYMYWGAGIYAEATSGATSSARLDEWLQAGGASLCRQAENRLGLP